MSCAWKRDRPISRAPERFPIGNAHHWHARFSERLRRSPPQHRDLGRIGLRQDYNAQHALPLYSGRGTDCHDRGHRRAPAPAIPCRAPGNATAQYRGRRSDFRSETLTTGMLDFLSGCVEARLNIVISGGSGSGKTTMLNTLSRFIPEEERIVTIEDTAELQLQQSHVVRLETRPPNIEGAGAISDRKRSPLACSIF